MVRLNSADSLTDDNVNASTISSELKEFWTPTEQPVRNGVSLPRSEVCDMKTQEGFDTEFLFPVQRFSTSETHKGFDTQFFYDCLKIHWTSKMRLVVTWNYEKKFGQDTEKWKKALKEIGNLKGWEQKNIGNGSLNSSLQLFSIGFQITKRNDPLHWKPIGTLLQHWSY
ncbi:hypothetical protein NE237_008251 [Protea cynaroides]|uniref:Uncharacterized protein n=1 Tax=Protea cynaroides TaxID=273540 RepID=A0A9Q0GNH1_9MAGN|nr:hypothetical protein NE237_008251 [Protea cynaroides]